MPWVKSEWKRWSRGYRLGAALLLGAMSCTATDSIAAEGEEALRAAIFYPKQIWVQDINIMEQIAVSMENALQEAETVHLSCYGMEELVMEDAVEAAINMQTDILIYNGIDSEEAAQNYSRLQEQGIRLLLVDGDVESSGRLAYIGTDNEKAGWQAAEYIDQAMGSKAVIGVIAPALDTGLQSVGARLRGFAQASRERNMKVEVYCETTYDSLTAMQRIESMLDEQPQVKVSFCGEAVAGQAAADVGRERGLEEELTVLTYDMNSRISQDLRDRALDVTFVQDTEAVGKACADFLLQLAEEKNDLVPEDILFDCIPTELEDLVEESYES